MVTVQNDKNKQCMIVRDCNVDLLRFKLHAKTNDFLEGIFFHVISKPTKVITSSATLIVHKHSNLIASSYHSGIIINYVAGYFVYMKENLSTAAKPTLRIDHLMRKIVYNFGIC